MLRSQDSQEDKSVQCSAKDSTWTIPVPQEGESHPDLVEVSSRNTLKRASLKGSGTNVQRNLLIGIACLAIIAALLIIVVGVLSYNYDQTKSMIPQITICTTNECIETAANFIGSIDFDTDPCEDFYQFSCGKWAENHPIQDFAVSTDWFFERKLHLGQRIHDVLERNYTKPLPDPVIQARKLYQSCLNTDEIDVAGLQPLLLVLNYSGLPRRPNVTANSTTSFSYRHSYPVLENGSTAYPEMVSSNLSAQHKWIATVVGSRRVVGKEHLIGFAQIGSPSMTSPLPEYDPRQTEQSGKLRGWKWQETSSWASRRRNTKIFTSPQLDRRRRNADVEKENDLPDNEDDHDPEKADNDEENQENDDQEAKDSEEYNDSDDDKNDEDGSDENVVESRLTYMQSVIKLMDIWGSLKNASVDPTIIVDYVIKQLNSEDANGDGKANEMRNYLMQVNKLQESVLKLYLQAVQEEADREAEALTVKDTAPPFHEMSLKDLQKMTDEAAYEANPNPENHIDWEIYFTKLFEGVNVTLDFETDLIIVQDLNYLKNIARLLAKTSPSVLEGLLWWEVMYVLAPHSSSVLRHLHNSYVEKATGGEVPRARSMSCASTTNEMMGMAVSWLLADEELSSNKSMAMGNSSNVIEEKRLKVQEMLTDIRDTFKDLVSELQWMDEETKAATLKKAKAMKSFIGYPSWLMDPKELEFYYEGLQIADLGYLQNLLSVVQVGTIWSLKDLRNENDVETWATDPTDVNAFHTFQDNAVTIPAGILQFPFYGLGLDVLNYGAIGSILGHELTHGFDNSGRHYDERGNWRQWWSNKTVNEYLNRSSCFVDQYSSYLIPEVKANVNGKRTLGENIADNGGMHESIRAFRRFKEKRSDYKDIRLPGLEQFSQEHLMFLSFANLWCEHGNQETQKWVVERDEHSPSKARVWGTVSNSEDFSRLFKCPKGSRMNPEVKCRIW
ncbi:hypothetical protein J437_LFUL001839 [Ladona fulva]|uniref:Endothelin-converting enzyme 1 n=1 Tax=Ladona fulva TaxID=123851 RepID=A0A8K0JUW7_LADFU|nr:hypothetical protein J437_LFUL001839 [Ladona fulva]